MASVKASHVVHVARCYCWALCSSRSIHVDARTIKPGCHNVHPVGRGIAHQVHPSLHLDQRSLYTWPSATRVPRWSLQLQLTDAKWHTCACPSCGPHGSCRWVGKISSVLNMRGGVCSHLALHIGHGWRSGQSLLLTNGRQTWWGEVECWWRHWIHDSCWSSVGCRWEHWQQWRACRLTCPWLLIFLLHWFLIIRLQNHNDTGGGPCRASPERHRSLGKIGAQRITIYTERNVIISLPYIGQVKQGAKHTKNPHVKGTHTQDNTIWYGSSKQSNKPPNHTSGF